MSKSPFEIPAPVLKKLDELNEIVKEHTAYEVIFMAVSRRGAISFGFAHMHSKIYGEKMPSIGVMPGI